MKPGEYCANVVGINTPEGGAGINTPEGGAGNSQCI